MKHFKYLSYVVRHKWFVFRAGLRTGAPLHRLLIHDWSKFLPSEWLPYVNNFYGDRKTNSTKAAFDLAWLRHQKRNKHHWQYWVLLNDSDPGNVYPNWQFQSKDGGLTLGSIMRYDKPNVPDYESEVDLENTGLVSNDNTSRALSIMKLTFNANRYYVVPIPAKYLREMLADWAGAGRAITGKWDVVSWYEKNKDKIILHPDSRKQLESLMDRSFGKTGFERAKRLGLSLEYYTL